MAYCRGRESRSAATSAAAPRARQPLTSTLALLVLALLSTMPHRGGASSHGLVLPPPQLRNSTCHDVPYPFGRRGASLLGFEVVCGPKDEAMLPIAGNLYRIDSVSVPESYVVIFAGPLSQVCYDRRGKPIPDAGTGPMSLEGTPFTFSKKNTLVNIGCNYNLLVNFTKPPGDFVPWPWVTCTTSCSGSSDAIIGGSCSGDACCELDIPDLVNAAQSFKLSFHRVPGSAIGVEDDDTCSAAFFLDKDDQIFTFEDADDGKQRPLTLRQALVPPGERRMILDWAISSSTCDQARGYSLEPLCRDMGVCVDAPRGVGYLCRCRDGYEGNPYVSGGGGCQGNEWPSSSAREIFRSPS
jgi:hypothetical protein